MTYINFLSFQTCHLVSVEPLFKGESILEVWPSIFDDLHDLVLLADENAKVGSIETKSFHINRLLRFAALVYLGEPVTHWDPKIRLEVVFSVVHLLLRSGYTIRIIYINC